MDLNAQVGKCVTAVANARTHVTTKSVPAERFATLEQPMLRSLPSQGYRALVLPAAGTAPSFHPRTDLPRVTVERRPLETYTALARGDL